MKVTDTRKIGTEKLSQDDLTVTLAVNNDKYGLPVLTYTILSSLDGLTSVESRST